MSAPAVNFLYEVKDITRTAYRTRFLLRLANNLRLVAGDIQEVMKGPTIGNVFWTLVQLMRTYNSLRRLLRLLQASTSASAALVGMVMDDVMIPEGPTTPTIIPEFVPMQMSVEAFRDNIPMRMESIDISDLPDKTRERLQEIFEDDAEMTVMDARAILKSRIIWPEYSTGNLENSIQWQPTVNGVRVFADAYYAWWVEQGHDNFLGHWYMSDAAEMAKQRLPLRVQAELSSIINENV